MNETVIRKAADKADKLASFVRRESYRSFAFAVLFERLLGASIKLSIRDAGSKKAQAPKVGPTTRAKAGPTRRVRELVNDNFFKTRKSLKAVLAELTDRGHGYGAGIIGKALQRMCQERLLRRTKAKEGKRSIYVYTNW